MIPTPGSAQQPGAMLGLDRVVNRFIPDISYNVVPHHALPEGDQALPSGDHLLLATTDQKLKGKVCRCFEL